MCVAAGLLKALLTLLQPKLAPSPRHWGNDALYALSIP